MVPRRWGKVVQRNRAKRVLREILRTSLANLVRGMDILVIPKDQLSVDDHQKVCTELQAFLKSLGLFIRNSHA
ncbi:MAG: ribonuclease P protein component [Nitrospira sp.]|nr:ribonuclease P protein component [Nitrospira sp.]